MEPDVSQQHQGRERALADIREILDGQRFAVLSTHAEGQPYASLVAFSATGNLRQLFFCTPRLTRKYANLSCDARVAILVHTSRNTAVDFGKAVAVTATGTSVEIPIDQRGVEAAAFLAKHPELADFVGDPQNALLAVEVSDYHLVRRFQDVVRIHMGQGGDVPGRERQKKATMSGVALVLLAHGSRDAAWRSWFEQLALSLDVSLGRGRVQAAYLQFSSPTLLEAVTSAAERGFRQIAVLPVFISAGGHVMKDVPAQVAAVEEQWRSLEITILPRVGEYKEFEQLVRQIVQDAIGSSNTRLTDQGPGLP